MFFEQKLREKNSKRLPEKKLLERDRPIMRRKASFFTVEIKWWLRCAHWLWRSTGTIWSRKLKSTIRKRKLVTTKEWIVNFILLSVNHKNMKYQFYCTRYSSCIISQRNILFILFKLFTQPYDNVFRCSSYKSCQELMPWKNSVLLGKHKNYREIRS